MQKRSPAHLALGAAIRRRRRRLGISQEALADICEIDRSYMGAIERGETNVAFAILLKIAHGLDTRLSLLMASFEHELKRQS